MIEVTMYVKDVFGFNGNYGVATLLYQKGRFGIGISVRNPQDNFSKTAGKEIAYERALANLEANPFTQIVEIEERFRKEFTRMLSGAPVDKMICFFNRFYDIKNEMCFKMAKEFMAEDAWF